MAFPSGASDGFMKQDAAELPAPGEKRRAATLLPPLPVQTAAGKRFTRQRSDSCLSGISTATGPDLARAFPGFAAAISSTPTSRARLDVSSASEVVLCAVADSVKDVELRGLLDSTVTIARDARSNALGARSPSATGSLTFHSINRRHASSGVECEEELDDEGGGRGAERRRDGAVGGQRHDRHWCQPSSMAPALGASDRALHAQVRSAALPRHPSLVAHGELRRGPCRAARRVLRGVHCNFLEARRSAAHALLMILAA